MRTLAVFNEEFGEVVIYTKSSGIKLTSLHSLQIGIKKMASSRLIDIEIQYTELYSTFPEYSILLPVLLYQLKIGSKTELKYTGSYKALSLLVHKNRRLPIALFCQMRRTELANLNTIHKEKAIIIKSKEFRDLRAYSTVLIAADLDLVTLSLNNQSLLWLGNGACNINGINNSRIIFQGKCKGSFNSDEIYLGTKSKVSGRTESGRLIVSDGAVLEGEVELKA
jgi:hypothetical protein